MQNWNRVLIVVSVIALLSLYYNYKQYRDKMNAESRIEALANVGKTKGGIQASYIAGDSSKHVVYTKTLVSNNAEKIIATNGFVDTLAKSIGVKVGNIQELTRVKAIVSDTVKATFSASNSLYSYANKWLDIKLNTADSTLMYNYKIEIVDTKYYTGNWLFGKTLHRDFSIKDPNAKIYGVQGFELEPERQKRFGVGIQVGYSTSDFSNYKPYVGIGISYNLFNF